MNSKPLQVLATPRIFGGRATWACSLKVVIAVFFKLCPLMMAEMLTWSLKGVL